MERKLKVRRLSRYVLLLTIVLLTVFFLHLVMLWVRPYNEVYFLADTSLVKTKVVVQGGELELENAGYCNNNQDISVDRWMDVVGPDGRVSGSYQIPTIEFFQKGLGDVCYTPIRTKLTLPIYVLGPNNTASNFRMRQIISYKPNAVKTVYVHVQSEVFRIIPRK